jgi:hypothetical protein
MTTYLIKDHNNKVIYQSNNYLETINKYQELKRIDNRYLTIFVKSFLNKIK